MTASSVGNHFMYIEIRHVRAFLAVASELHFRPRSATIEHRAAGAQPDNPTSRGVARRAVARAYEPHRPAHRRRTCLPRARHPCRSATEPRRQGGETRRETATPGRSASATSTLPSPARCPKWSSVSSTATPTSRSSLCRRIPRGWSRRLPTDSSIAASSSHPPGTTRSTRAGSSRRAPVVVVPVSHRLGLKSKLRLADLAAEPFVVATQNGWRPFHQAIEQLSIKAGFIPEICQEVGQIDAMLALISAEMGIGVCPESIRMMAP